MDCQHRAQSNLIFHVPLPYRLSSPQENNELISEITRLFTADKSPPFTVKEGMVSIPCEDSSLWSLISSLCCWLYPIYRIASLGGNGLRTHEYGNKVEQSKTSWIWIVRRGRGVERLQESRDTKESAFEVTEMMRAQREECCSGARDFESE